MDKNDGFDEFEGHELALCHYTPDLYRIRPDGNGTYSLIYNKDDNDGDEDEEDEFPVAREIRGLTPDELHKWGVFPVERIDSRNAVFPPKELPINVQINETNRVLGNGDFMKFPPIPSIETINRYVEIIYCRARDVIKRTLN